MVVILMVVTIVIVSSCVDSEKVESKLLINEWSGKHIVLPHLSNRFSYNEKSKIVTRINGNCSQCIFKLKLWSDFLDEVESKACNCDIQYYFYISGADTSAFHAINESIIHFNYPVIFDTRNTFLRENNFPKNSLFHTFLLDSTNRVILVGTPIMNSELQKLYINEIIKNCKKLN